MAMFLFTKAIIEGQPIQLFNNGEMERDFTYVDDIVDGVIRVLKNPATGNEQWNGFEPEPSTSKAPYQLYNIGNSAPVKLTAFIDAIENRLKKKGEKILMPMQPGDVHKTFADITAIKSNFGYNPSTSIQQGVNKFIDWYIDYFNTEG
jgi:UDP-glucuronate 4-epimerase